MFEVILGIVSAATLLLLIVAFFNDWNVSNLKRDLFNSNDKISVLRLELRRLENKVSFVENLPQIQEYANLTKQPIFQQYNDKVQFFKGECSPCSEDFYVYEISKKLASAKELLAANCPKKCKRK